MPTQQDELNAIAQERADRMSEQVAWFTGAFEKILDQWNAEIAALVTALPSDHGHSRLADLEYLKAQIGRQLAALGYADLARQFLSFTDEAEAAAVRQLEVLGISPSRLAPINQDILRTLREIDYSKFFRASETTISVVSESIVMNFIGGVPLKDVYTAIENSLGQFKHLTAVYAETAWWITERYVHWETIKQVVEKVKYDGVRDEKNRPFCAEHIGKVYTLKELDELDNGAHQPKPIHIWFGGWGCRHYATPVVP